MIALVLKVAVLLVALVVGFFCLWFSTPWGYKKPLYRRVVRADSLLDNPQLLRAVGIGGFFYAVIWGFWIVAAALDKLKYGGTL
jgi:hypothetical protein